MILGPTQSPYEGTDGTNNLVLHLQMHNFFLSLLEIGKNINFEFYLGLLNNVLFVFYL
jgi:hypothetical protein